MNSVYFYLSIKFKSKYFLIFNNITEEIGIAFLWTVPNTEKRFTKNYLKCSTNALLINSLFSYAPTINKPIYSSFLGIFLYYYI